VKSRGSGWTDLNLEAPRTDGEANSPMKRTHIGL
jgi:hypothetical protein